MYLHGSETYLKDGIQQFLGEGNEGACCALCLLNVAQCYNAENGGHYAFDALEVLNEACKGPTKSSVIYYNKSNLQDNNNFFVQDPPALLKMCTGKVWEYRKEGPDYKPKKGEYVFNYYERVKTGSVTGHFEADNFHPIIGSLTVKYGKLHSKRVCRVIYG